MSDPTESQNPMEFFKSLWGNMGFPLPGMVTPTVDTDELGRRITDLKAVEGWLKSNLSMLQMTIQGLEMQRATLMALQAMSQQATESQPSQDANPFANPALWPWGFMQPAPTTGDTASEEQPKSVTEPPSAPKRKPKR
jgi:hypothetical protein